ncbi:MAG TPA: cation:proton antiporter [Chloroflexota bacterium]|nr:cation:proton antiporter [Chloroflexota bacterium]
MGQHTAAASSWGPSTVEHVNVILAVFGGGILILNTFSTALQRMSLPAPLLALVLGVVVGPYGLDLITLQMFGGTPSTVLEEAARLTLAVALTGVALRLPHGYWSQNRRWVIAIIALGMGCMWAVSTGIIWALLGLPFTLALLVGAIVTPTDPVVSTPIVTGSVAEGHIPDRVRYNISAESGLNDGLTYLFVFLPVLLLTKPDPTAWREWLSHVLMREVLAACLLGVVVGFLVAKLFVWATTHNVMEQSAYTGFVIALALLLLGLFKLMGTNAILGVFLAVAVFGQAVPQSDEQQEDRQSEVINRFFIIPIFILLGMGLPIEEWTQLGLIAPTALVSAVLVRRLITVWLLRPFYRDLHSGAETLFLSWFAAVGVSAL